MSAPAWFHNRILTGVQRLQTLSLVGTPAADIITLTAATWVDVLWPLKAWEQERDERRLGTAFAKLSGVIDRWPAPKQLLIELPKIREPLALPEPTARPTAEQLARLQRLSRKLARRLTTDPDARGEQP